MQTVNQRSPQMAWRHALESRLRCQDLVAVHYPHQNKPE